MTGVRMRTQVGEAWHVALEYRGEPVRVHFADRTTADTFAAYARAQCIPVTRVAAGRYARSPREAYLARELERAFERANR